MSDIRVKEVEEPKEKGDKTPLKFSKKGRKKRGWSRKKTVFLVLAVIVGLLGFFGVKTFNIINKIFEGSGLYIPGLLGDVDQLKGEEEGRVNVLFLGIGGDGHAGGTLADTIMVVSLDTKNKSVAMISIPRDMYVNIPDYGYARINEAHAAGEKEEEGSGPEKTKETVSRILNIPIHYYARADFKGFEKIVDTLGGIDIYVEKDLYDPYYPDGGTYSVKKGQHHMDGEEALKYARSRKTTSDFDRAKRQQLVIVAVKEKIENTYTIFNPKKLLDIMNILGDHVKTDLQLAELKRMYDIGKSIDSARVVNKVIDNGDTGLLISANVGGASVLKPRSGDFSEIRDFVQNVFDELTIKNEQATLTIVNSTGTDSIATKEAEKLGEVGMIVKEKETGDSTKKKTIIYDYTDGGKPATLEYLSNKYDADIINETALTEGLDIKLVIGTDYWSNN